MKAWALAACLCVALAGAAEAQDLSLPRKAALGVAVEAGGGGARILQVVPGLTASQAGLKPGDVITALNGQPVSDNRALVALADALRAGDRVLLTYHRDGARGDAAATAKARPEESYMRASARYGAVPFRGGLLRDILVTPDKAAAGAPVVFLIQGYSCATMEGIDPKSAYHALVQGLADSGIATYRIEKPGMGDSRGGPNCFAADFETELTAFREGLKALTDTHAVAPGRIVLLGHSMGAVEAPLLAAERTGVRGLAVYGGVMRSWHDYMQDLMRLQAFFSTGADPVEAEAFAEAMRPLLNRIFMTQAPLKTIAAETPQGDQLLREALEWDGEEMILGRTAAYWRGVSEQRLAKAWRDAAAPVLAIYGEVDYAAIDDRDHRLIVDVVNHYRPGAGRFVRLARTGHGMGVEGSPAQAQEANRAGKLMQGAYNPELTRLLVDWISGLPDPKS